MITALRSFARYVSATSRARLALVVAAGLLLSGCLAYAFTPLESPRDVLAVNEWGAGRPDSSWITAFATGRQWWYKCKPNAFASGRSRELSTELRLPRAEIRQTTRKVLPIRGIGYDALLGGITAIRSLGQPDVVIDLALIVRLQEMALLGMLALMPVVPFSAYGRFRKPSTFALYCAATVVVFSVWPTEPRYLVNGIIDSALANALSLACAASLFFIVNDLEVRSPVAIGRLCIGSLVLGYCPLIRGEFIFIIGFAIAVLTLVASLKDRHRLPRLAICIAIVVTPAVTYGLANQAIFGHFVPLRMQSGQNLVEPIGQYPNDYGIEYDDQWAEDFLRANGIKYKSFEADQFMTDQYVRLVRENPGMFVGHFLSRLAYFRDFFRLPLYPVLLFAGLAGVIWGMVRNNEFAAFAQPFVLLVGFVLFCGWTNQLPRLITPIHFLANISMCFLCVYFGYSPLAGQMVAIVLRRPREISDEAVQSTTDRVGAEASGRLDIGPSA